MIKEELKIMLGNNHIDLVLNDEDIDLAIKIAGETYSQNNYPFEYRQLALAECLSILGLIGIKFSDTLGNYGKECLEQSNTIRNTLRESLR